jgi:prepilin-type N-terminal cleavage/methylation domain-containing protein
MKNRGFTLVEIMIVIAIIGLIAAIAIPNFIKAREDSMATACATNLEQINGAKQQVAFAQNLGPSDTVPNSELVLYLQLGTNIGTVDGSTNLCPAGGTYAVGTMAQLPTCTLASGPGLHQVE